MNKIEKNAEYLAEHTGVFVKKMNVDIAGDYVTGAVLSQLLYWSAKTRIRRNEKMWIAKSHTDMTKETGISRRQYERSLKKLVDIGLIEKATWPFKNSNTTHIHLNIDVYNQMVAEWKANTTKKLNSENETMSAEQDVQTIVHDAHSSVHDVQLITETTHETTTQIDDNTSSPDAPTSSSIDWDAVKDMFNTTCADFPRIKCITGKRKEAIITMLSYMSTIKEYSDMSDMDILHQLFSKAQSSDFLSGRNGKWSNCSFDWMIKKSNALKVIQGNYDDKPNKTSNDNIIRPNAFINFPQRDPKDIRALARRLTETTPYGMEA